MLTHRTTSLLLQIALLILIAGTLAHGYADWYKQTPLRGPGGRVVATAVTPDGTRAATVTNDGHVSLWDIPNRKLIRTEHLPDGKPIHLAIRGQGDAVAIAYEDADAVIWWCDGSGKVIRPSVRARLVAFAHQKRLLVVAQPDGWGSSWNIDNGQSVNLTDVSGLRIDGPYIAVLPNDEGAVVFNNSPLGANGFRLDADITLSTGGNSSFGFPEEPLVINPPDALAVYYQRTTNVTFYEWDVKASERKDIHLPTNYTLPPVCSKMVPPPQTQQGGMVSFNFGGGLTPAYHCAVVSQGPGKATAILTGNTSGDLIIYQRATSTDWFKHPAPWLVVPCFLLLGWVMLEQRWDRLENPRPPIDLGDALLALPRPTVIASWIIAGIGVISVGGFIYGLVHGSLTINFVILALPSGILILSRKRNGWRKFAAFIGWVTMAGGALMLGATAIGQQPLEFTLGQSASYQPVWVGVLVSIFMLGLGVFLYLALTHRIARRICRAASDPALGSRQRQLNALQRCPDCGYDTRRTIADNLSACPECGRKLVYSLADQVWISNQLDGQNTPQ